MALKQSLLLALVGLAALAVAEPRIHIPGLDKHKGLEPGVYANADEHISDNDNLDDQSVVIGRFNRNDKLLLQETAHKTSMAMIVRDTDIVYPKKNQAGEKITGIKILDQRKDGKNAQVTIKDGGLGFEFVKLRFDSQRGHGLEYLVQIYGSNDQH